jgi:hypothetical protein
LPVQQASSAAASVILDGLPYTFCPRRTRQDCIDRLGNNGNFMLSHATQSSIVATIRRTGPAFSTQFGNETNLKEPVRVVMGSPHLYGMNVLVSPRPQQQQSRSWMVCLPSTRL